MIRETAKSGRAILNREIPLGQATALRASILPVKTGGLSETVVVLNSLTSTPVFEQNLRRLDRLASLGTLSASMAHEIKNGMVAIKTFVDVLAQKGQDTELTEIVGRELERINAIVTQMLRFAAPNRAAFATVRVHDLLDHSLRLMQHQINGKLISLQRHYRAEPDTVRGDDAQLQQAFMNLLLNALEAMGTNGVLTVGTEMVKDEQGGRQLRINIQDTGVGIAPENLERLFEPFFTTKSNGTGLGLAISQRIVLEHHGQIRVQSDPGKGSQFSLSLPAFRPPEPLAFRPASRPWRPASTNGRLILFPDEVIRLDGVVAERGLGRGLEREGEGHRVIRRAAAVVRARGTSTRRSSSAGRDRRV